MTSKCAVRMSVLFHAEIVVIHAAVEFAFQRREEGAIQRRARIVGGSKEFINMPPWFAFEVVRQLDDLRGRKGSR